MLLVFSFLPYFISESLDLSGELDTMGSQRGISMCPHTTGGTLY